MVLSDIGAQLLLVHAGQDAIEPVTAAGVFELIIRGGLVTRYRLRLEGVLLIGRKRVTVRQTSDTVIKDVERRASSYRRRPARSWRDDAMSPGVEPRCEPHAADASQADACDSAASSKDSHSRNLAFAR